MTAAKGLAGAAALGLAMGAAGLLGGSAGAPPALLAAIELASLPALFFALRALDAPRRRAAWAPLALLTLAAATPLLQLVPLPPGVWSRLPGRDLALASLQAARVSPSWAPLSLDPAATWACALAFAAPAAQGLGLLGAARGAQGAWLAAWMALGLLNLAMGALQLAGAPAYPWPDTVRGTLAGLFENRNHLATLLAALIPAAVVLAAGEEGAAPAATRWIALAFLPAALAALAVLGSRAGVALAACAAMAGAVLAVIASERGLRRRLAVAVGLGLAATAIAGVAGWPVLAHRFAGLAGEGRLQAWPYVTRAVAHFFPAGAGMGTFGEAYPPFEPLNLLQVNGFEHAHNEYLEIALESGLAGVTLVALFLIWAAAASVRVWRAAAAAPLPAAAAVGVWVMLLHAALDFSLRTLTDACLLGLLCGILASAGSPGAPRRASAPG